MRRARVDFELLAGLLVSRLTPALPEGVLARQGTEEDVADLRRIRARWAAPPGVPSRPEYGLSDGVIVIHVLPPPARRVIPISYSDRSVSVEHLAEAVNEALRAVADEASEASADHYESDAAIENGELRIWFGVVPARASPGWWREVVAELAPIRLDQIAA